MTPFRSKKMDRPASSPVVEASYEAVAMVCTVPLPVTATVLTTPVAGWDAVEWAKRAVSLGSGEIVLNSIDADGTKAGFDLVITRRISEAVGVPVVASGGAGKLEHMAEVLLEGKADAVLAASIFHFGEFTVGDVKKFLAQKNIPVRL